MEQTAIKEKAQRAELLRQAARGSVPLTPAPEKLDADIDFYASADLYDDDDDDLQKPPLEFTVTDCADEDFTDEDYEPLAFGCEAVEEFDRDADRDASEKQSDRKRKTELEAASPINNKTPRGAVDQLVAQLPKWGIPTIVYFPFLSPIQCESSRSSSQSEKCVRSCVRQIIYSWLHNKPPSRQDLSSIQDWIYA